MALDAEDADCRVFGMAIPEGSMFCVLDLHDAFQDFNFSFKWDPAMRERPGEADLLEMVYRGRQGNIFALDEFADAVYFTLRPAAFDTYQRFQGPVGISYEEWFQAKLFQFLGILLYETVEVVSLADGRLSSTDFPIENGLMVIGHEGEVIQPDEIEETFRAGDNDCGTWLELAKTVSNSHDNRLQVAQEWLRAYRKTSASGSSQKRGWFKNQDRDTVIRNCLARGMERGEICRELDKRTLPTISALQSRGLHKWTDGWAEPQSRKSIQTLFSKVGYRV